MEGVELPESSVELAVIGSLLMAVVGDGAQIKRSLEAGADIAHTIATMDLTVVRLREQQHDTKVREHFAQAETWMRAFASRSELLGS